MKYYNWDNEKNRILKEDRNISFEEIIFQILNDGLIEIIEHTNNEKYAGQKIYIVKHKDYVYLVPFVERDNELFLKTIFPSRKYTKKYLGDSK
ncbi:MAG: BrnT family toxin [Candidatus Cloacimonetes bacterium]|nr:BrnT family toxin [Candidatus Cloacimonadota bacterium]